MACGREKARQEKVRALGCLFFEESPKVPSLGLSMGLSAATRLADWACRADVAGCSAIA